MEEQEKTKELDRKRIKAWIEMWENAEELYSGIKILSNGYKETHCLPYLK